MQPINKEALLQRGVARPSIRGDLNREFEGEVHVTPSTQPPIRPGWRAMTLKVKGKEFSAARFEDNKEAKFSGRVSLSAGGLNVGREDLELHQKQLLIRGDASAPLYRIVMRSEDLTALDQLLAT